MARQESEDRTVPEAPGNRSQTRRARPFGGGRAVPVKEEERQQRLNFATAENPRKGSGAESRRDADRSTSRKHEAPKAKDKPTRVAPARMDRLGMKPRTAWRRVYDGRQSIWALSHNPVVERGLRNAYFAERGLASLLERFRLIWAAINAPAQLALPLETERS